MFADTRRIISSKTKLMPGPERVTAMVPSGNAIRKIDFLIFVR